MSPIWTRKGSHQVLTLSPGATLEIEPVGRKVQAWHRRTNGKALNIGVFQSEILAKGELEHLADELKKLYRITGE